MDQRVPIQVQDVLTEYISRFHEGLPHTLEGLYLQGSIALNAYLDGTSDIDFKSLAFLMPNRFSDQELQWCMTGMLRQFYTLCEYEIISKVEAGNYAIDVMPERWHHIIR